MNAVCDNDSHSTLRMSESLCAMPLWQSMQVFPPVKRKHACTTEARSDCRVTAALRRDVVAAARSSGMLMRLREVAERQERTRMPRLPPRKSYFAFSYG